MNWLRLILLFVVVDVAGVILMCAALQIATGGGHPSPPRRTRLALVPSNPDDRFRDEGGRLPDGAA